MTDPLAQSTPYGTVRWRDGMGKVWTCSPTDPRYGTALFMAEEIFKDNKWHPFNVSDRDPT